MCSPFEPQAPTSASSLKRIAAWALAPVVAANAWVGLNLTPLLHGTEVDTVLELDARVARCDHPERVRVLAFGNSHAQHALRPPSLGPALGLAPEAAFNLALPAATAFELRLHVDRWLSRFPGAKLAVIGVDEVLLTAVPWFQQTRVKWLTRGSAERLRYAAYFPDAEEKFSTVTFLPFPVADFAQGLRAAVRADRRVFLAGAILGEEAYQPPPEHFQPYAYGYPPLPALPAEIRAMTWRHKLAAPSWMAHLADLFFGAPYARALALEDLEAACKALEARGVAVRLVGPVYAPALRRHLARHRAADLAAHREAVDAWLAASGRTLVTPPAPPTIAFRDADHLADDGAALYAHAVAPALRQALATRLTTERLKVSTGSDSSWPQGLM